MTIEEVLSKKKALNILMKELSNDIQLLNATDNQEEKSYKSVKLSVFSSHNIFLSEYLEILLSDPVGGAKIADNIEKKIKKLYADKKDFFKVIEK